MKSNLTFSLVKALSYLLKRPIHLKVMVPLIALLVMISLLNLAPFTMTDNPFISSSTPLVIAHQGGERLYPSNTLYAFEQAHKLGVDMFELDIHQSKDGHLVVIHDDSVDRTTNGQGKIINMNLAEIQALDAGYYWTEDGESYPYRAQGITIPTLAELFEHYPTMPMVIDIKDQDAGYEEKLCSLIKHYKKSKDVVIGSFHPNALKKFRNFCPEVATSMHPTEVRNMVLLSYTFLKSLFRPTDFIAAQVPVRSGAIKIIHPGFVKLAKQRKIAVQVWTVNDPEEMQYLIDLGVDGIMTDRPDLLLDLLQKQNN